MVAQRLRPGVQHGEEADGGAQVPAIAGDALQGLRGGAEQDPVEDLLVAQSQRRDLRRDGEHDVEIGHREQLRGARLEPGRPLVAQAGRAVPIAAGVVGDALGAAVIAAIHVPAQRARAAAAQRRHDGAPGGRDRVAALGQERGAEAADDVAQRGRPLGHGRRDGAGVTRPARCRSDPGGSSWRSPAGAARGYRAPWSTAARGRATPAACGCRCPPRADGWRSSGARRAA